MARASRSHEWLLGTFFDIWARFEECPIFNSFQAAGGPQSLPEHFSGRLIKTMETSQNVVDVLRLQARNHELAKTLTGIRGLDEITRGGLPKGRPTLVCGGPGSGKTLLGLTFLVNGAVHFDEPGVLMTFEENVEEITSDVDSLGFDLPDLIDSKKLAVDYVRVERS